LEGNGSALDEKTAPLSILETVGTGSTMEEFRFRKYAVNELPRESLAFLNFFSNEEWTFELLGSRAISLGVTAGLE